MTKHRVDEADDVRFASLVHRIEENPSTVKVVETWPAEAMDYKFPVKPTWAHFGSKKNGVNFQFDNLCVDTSGESCIVFIFMYNGNCSVHSYADTYDAAKKAVEWVKQSIPQKAIEEDDVGLYFWSLGKQGPSQTWREIAAPTWGAIQRNYPEDVREKLGELMVQDLTDDRSGHLLLWTGPPGTGKTYAIRSWMQALKKHKVGFHYIVDPDAFFGDASYMMHVCLNSEGHKAMVLILEDAGTLVAADARERTGQGLSRLLNLSDGLVGQGLKLHILITTNEELGVLNEAAIREGRCRSKISFREFEAAEAGQWMDDVANEKWTLADMYASVEHRKREKDAIKKVGFAT